MYIVKPTIIVNGMGLGKYISEKVRSRGFTVRNWLMSFRRILSWIHSRVRVVLHKGQSTPLPNWSGVILLMYSRKQCVWIPFLQHASTHTPETPLKLDKQIQHSSNDSNCTITSIPPPVVSKFSFIFYRCVFATSVFY